MTTQRPIKKMFFIALCMLAFSAVTFAATEFRISEKLLQTFKQTFPDAQQVVWSEQGDRFTVNFRQDEILTKVEYDADGNFINSLRYYSEKNLPVTILCRLQKKYSDKKIYGVTEMATESSVEYYIKLVDDTNWITVRANIDGTMQVVEKYKKAS
jgi:hypothetical protein